MSYLEKAVNFLTSYDYVVLTTVFALAWVFGIVNWCKNPYRKPVQRLARCQRNVLANPALVDVYLSAAPEEYRRQWRAYANCGAERPSLVFEFVPRKKRVVAVWLFVLCAVVSSVYLALFVMDVSRYVYAVFQAAFWLSFVIVMCVNNAIFAKHEKRARQAFGKFVAQLNAVKPDARPQAKQVAEKIDDLKRTKVDGAALEKAAEILHQYGLENDRTVEQQRQINHALNGLLQSYARNAARHA